MLCTSNAAKHRPSNTARCDAVCALLDTIEGRPDDPPMQVACVCYQLHADGTPTVLDDREYHADVKRGVVVVAHAVGTDGSLSLSLRTSNAAAGLGVGSARGLRCARCVMFVVLGHDLRKKYEHFLKLCQVVLIKPLTRVGEWTVPQPNGTHCFIAKSVKPQTLIGCRRYRYSSQFTDGA